MKALSMVCLGLLIAAAIITVSVALRSMAGSFAMLFFAVALFGIGGPLVSVGAPKLISAWFEGRERGLAIGEGTLGVLQFRNSQRCSGFRGCQGGYDIQRFWCQSPW